MTKEVKLFGKIGSSFGCRVQIALKLKGVKYEFIEEDLTNMSPELLKYNPIHKKIPVLLHDGNPIVESALIVQYIDEVWKGPSILPEDPYDKAMARFWAKLIDDKLTVAVWNTFYCKGEEQEKAIEQADEVLKALEEQLTGKRFFGGDVIGLVDIVAVFIAYWIPILEEVTGVKLVTNEKKYPKLAQWTDDFVSCNVAVKECLPPRDFVFTYFQDDIPKAQLIV